MAVINAQGTTFTFDDSLSAAVTVGGIISFSGFDGEAADIDVTTLASTAKEFRPGLQDFGNFSIDLIIDNDDVGVVELREALTNQEARTCILTLPTSTLNVATFEAYVKSISTGGSVDDVARGTVNMKIDGAVVWS